MTLIHICCSLRIRLYGRKEDNSKIKLGTRLNECKRIGSYLLFKCVHEIVVNKARMFHER